MSFYEHLFSTAFATVAGFVFSLLLFALQFHWSRKAIKNTLIKNLDFELQYNEKLIRDFIKDLNDSLADINNEKRNTYINIDYEKIAFFFAQQFYREGIISEFFETKGMDLWNEFYITIRVGNDIHIKQQITDWRENKIHKAEAYDSVKYEIKILEHALETLGWVRNRISGKINN